MKSRYAHIHSHTEFSALDGLSTCGELASRAAELGHSRVAITDHGTCAGHMEHQRACDAAGIMPVFGMEAYFREDRTYRPPAGDKEAQKAGRSDYEHLILLAVNDQGLHDLWALSTEGFRSGFYYVPRIDWDVLEEYGSNLICTTACLGGIVSRQLLSGRTEEAMQRLDRLRGIFGNRLYLEVGANDQGNQIELNKRLALIGGSLGIQLIAASDSHFARPEDAPYQEAWLRCQTRGEDDYWHLVHAQSDDEAFELLRHLGDDTAHEAMHNAAVAAALCDARIRGSIEPPVFTGSAREDGQLLLSSCLASWDRTRGRSRPQREYIRRFEREFDLLIRAGYCGYYNIVADYCGYARNAGILVGPGRGSGAGSLVAYLSKITGVDPLEHELLFERFLTEGRIGKSLPDFDVDFPASKRSEMQDYVTGKYGEERVVRVGTQGRYRNRGIIHKLMSVMEHDNWARAKADGNAISQIIDGAEEHTAGLGLTWDELHAQAGPLLEPYALRYPDVFRFAGRLAGRLSSYGRHASGVVISPDVSLAGRLPLRIGDEGDPMISQFGFEDLEWLGLTKFDFLTLRTLDTLQETADAVQDRSGRLQQMNDWSEQYEDPQVWDLISSGRTLGLFQLETSLCARMCTQLQPRSLEELAALIALVRPGPRNSGITRNYLERKGGRQEITTHDERITGALSATLGLMVYQEDVLRLCQVLAGYSLADADDVRKILGKKKTELINAEGDRFLSRCQEKGMPLAAAKAVWAEMAEFARYGFNRCVSGDMSVFQAGANDHHGGGTPVAELYRRIHAPLLAPVRGRTKSGAEYRGPCVVCGAEESASWTRGTCNACTVWRKKFLNPKLGVLGLAYFADGRIRPSRIIDVVQNGVRETRRITLADGKYITATENHRHLTDKGYCRVDDLAPGDLLITDGGYELNKYIPERDRTTSGDRQNHGYVNGAFGSDNFGYVDGGFASLAAWTAQAPRFCEQCGHDGSVIRLERAHLDGNRSNNDWSNLRMLCASCHKAYDYAVNNRNRRYQKGHASAAVPIVSIEYAGEQQTYDVIMDAPHNLVVNGIVTHNSHAFSYAVLGYWTAWFKAHYPVDFYTALLSTVPQDRCPPIIREAQGMGIAVLPPDINESRSGFTSGPMQVRYGLLSIKDVGERAVGAIMAGQPFASLADFTERKGSAVHAGIVLLLAKCGALDSLLPEGSHRSALVARLEFEKTDLGSKDCRHYDAALEGTPVPPGWPGGGCGFDWLTEPPPVSKTTGKALKGKLPPKKCTRACRQYDPGPAPDFDALPPYTPAQVRELELETLAIWLSSTPFDDMDNETREYLREQAHLLRIGEPGIYRVSGVIREMKLRSTRAGTPIGFMTLEPEEGNEIEIAVFADQLAIFRDQLEEGRMILAKIRKQMRQGPEGPEPRFSLTVAMKI